METMTATGITHNSISMNSLIVINSKQQISTRISPSCFILIFILIGTSWLPLATFSMHTTLRDLTLSNETLFDSESIPDDETSKCETMRISFCENVDYNRTMLPNMLGHTTQAEVESDIAVYQPFIQNACSPDMLLFLCSIYAPICFDHHEQDSVTKLLPCKSLCESARRGCDWHFKFVGREWPDPLNCDRFPDGRQKDIMCVGNDSHTMDGSGPDRDDHPARDLGFVCPRNFEVSGYNLLLNGRRYNNCAMPCEEVYLDKYSTRTVRVTVGIFAGICILSSLFTCITFLIDTKRFEYPARPIIIIAFCQLIVAACYMIGFWSQNKIACNEPVEPPKTLPNLKMIRSTMMGNKKGSCTLLFMTMYFFQLSTVMWWLMMTISWYMIAKMKWGPEAVNSVARYFHFSSWTLPALLTLYLSVLGDIEGDPLSGTCSISVSNEDSVKMFLITPVLICLALGCILLSMGFKSIWDSRQMLRLKFGNQTDEHFKLVIRIGLYSFLFITFSFIFAFSHYYELTNQTIWKLAWLSNVCKIRDYSIPCPIKNYTNQGPHPMVFIIKYAATMAIGLISALFMASDKTLKAYREVVGMYHLK